jgi:hypothetical protein
MRLPGPAPAPLTLWKWLVRAVREGKLEQFGLGTRKDPHTYALPGMAQVLQARFLERFMRSTDIAAEEGQPAKQGG